MYAEIVRTAAQMKKFAGDEDTVNMGEFMAYRCYRYEGGTLGPDEFKKRFRSQIRAQLDLPLGA